VLAKEQRVIKRTQPQQDKRKEEGKRRAGGNPPAIFLKENANGTGEIWGAAKKETAQRPLLEGKGWTLRR